MAITLLSDDRRIAAGRARRRGMAMAATVLVHALALLMILSGRAARPDAPPATTGLVLFDVLPPVVDQPVLPPPPLPLRRPALRDGGSAGQSRSRPRVSPMIRPAPPRQADLLATEMPSATPPGRIPLPDLLAIPDVPAGPGGGAEQGGAGGLGTGRGDGIGQGEGRAGLARALWITMPSVRQIEAYWPERARRERISGRVLLACIVPRPGPPRRCKVTGEFPQGIGFGASALRMSPLFRIRPVTRGPEVQKLPVIVPVTFNVPIEINLPTLKN